MDNNEQNDMTLWVDQQGHLWGYDNQGQMREWSFNDYGDLQPLEDDYEDDSWEGW